MEWVHATHPRSDTNINAVTSGNKTSATAVKVALAKFPPLKRNKQKMTDGGNKRQCVYIVRYGKTKFSLVESVGPFDSKTQRFVRQGFRMGLNLASCHSHCFPPGNW